MVNFVKESKKEISAILKNKIGLKQALHKKLLEWININLPGTTSWYILPTSQIQPSLKGGSWYRSAQSFVEVFFKNTEKLQ